MSNRVTIGQYYPADSPIHRLDPRVKLAASLIYITMIFMADSFPSAVFAGVFIIFAAFLSNVPVKLLIKGLRNILFILCFTVCLNIFFAPGETVIVEIGFFSITEEGLRMALRLAARLVLLIISSSVLTLTTTPSSLTEAIEFYLTPFAKIGLPAQEIAMMMTIALRFIPTLMEETEKIIKAQKARGADFETGSIIKRARALVPVLVPLFVSSFRRAEDLALAMESRCYRTDAKRTKMNALSIKKTDIAAMLCIALYSAAVIALRGI